MGDRCWQTTVEGPGCEGQIFGGEKVDGIPSHGHGGERKLRNPSGDTLSSAEC